jgi:hypothetical protein
MGYDYAEQAKPLGERKENQMEVDEARTLEKDAKVNRFRLEEEAENHANLLRYWAEEEALAENERDLAKIFLEETEARVELKIRAEPPVPKLTEAIVEALVTDNQEVKDAKQRYMKLIARARDYGVGTAVMASRGRQIDNLVVLYTRQYFSNPDGSRTADDKERADQRASLNRRDA